MSAVRKGEWNKGDLEHLAACPVCASTEWTPLHEALVDRIFDAASGTWKLMECRKCRCAFLNPRPSPATIGRAYSNYFTHSHGSARAPAFPQVAWFRRAAANAYRNRVYGTHLLPTVGAVGVGLARAVPALRLAVEDEAPGLMGVSVPRGERSMLLDVGCGSGATLARARAAGWQVRGVELDPVAADVARSQGIEVIAARVEEVDASFDGTFDRILLAHVIEHVHDPAAFLRHCRRLIRPGGRLWLETPNLDSVGHEVFGQDWRGLEPPRHLTLFRYPALNDLLRGAGFGEVTLSPPRNVYRYVFGKSEDVRRRRRAEEGRAADPEADRPVHERIRQACALVRKEPLRSEFLTVTATPASLDE